MDEKIDSSQLPNNQNKANKESYFVINQESLQTKEIEELIPNFPKFDINYENQDMNIFKEDILNYLRDRDKLIFNLIKSHKDHIEKTESKYSELTKRISNNYSDILRSTFFTERKDLGEQLAEQILCSLLRRDDNYHYENGPVASYFYICII